MDGMMGDGAGKGPMMARSGEEDARAGYTIYVNCYDDGIHDVFKGPLQPGSEAEYPDGMFGLESTEEALKAVIALKRQGPDYQAAEEEAMTKAFGAKDEAVEEEPYGGP